MNSLSILILLVLASNEDSTTDIDPLHTLKNYAQDFKVDHNYTREKVRIFKNILPYLPEDYLETGGRSIIATEKVLKVLEVIEFINTESAIPEPLEMDSVERAYKIVTTMQEQINNANIDKLGTILDIMVNKDHYKELVNVALEFMGNKEALKDPSNLSKLLQPFLGKEKMENNNLGKMLEILAMLEPGKEKEKKIEKEEQEQDEEKEEKEERDKEQPMDD